MNKNTKSALDEYREKLKSGEIKQVCLNPMQKLEKNPTSLRLAVNAQCCHVWAELKNQLKIFVIVLHQNVHYMQYDHINRK